MPKARTPTNILEIKGAFKKNPQRKKARENEPVVTEPLGPPPVYLSDMAKEIWAELVAECADGVLNRTHNKVMESWCHVLEHMRKVYIETGGPAENTWFVRHEKHADFFGMTAASASKVSAPKPPKPETVFD